MPRACLPTLLVLLALPAVGRAQDPASEGVEAAAEQPPIYPPIPLGSISVPTPPGALPHEAGPVTVQLTLAVDETGRVTDAAVTGPSGDPVLDEAALRAARALTFYPARMGAEPVAVSIEFPITFLPEAPPVPVIVPARLVGRVEVKGTREAGIALDLSAYEATPKPDREDPTRAEHYDLADEPAAVVTSGEDGSFAFEELPPGTWIIATGGGAYRQEKFLEVLAEGADREVLYRIRPTGLGETVVVARRDGDVPERVLTRDELRRMPGAGGDPLAAVQSLPGVIHTPPEFGGGESAQAPVLRGASAEDSVLYLDGLPIPVVFHPLSTQTITGDFLVDRAYLKPAAVDAYYGDLTGGVVGIDLRSPRKDRVGGFLEPGIGLTSFALEGPIAKRSRFYVGLRRSYYEIFFRLIGQAADLPLDFAIAPFFQDQQIVLEVDPTDALRLHLSYIGSSDGLKLLIEDEEDETGNSDLAFNLDTNIHRFTLRADVKAPFGLENRAALALTFWGNTFEFGSFLNSSERHTTFHLLDKIHAPLLPWLSLDGGVLFEVDAVKITERGALSVREDTGPRAPIGEEEVVAGRANPTRLWLGGFVGATFRPVEALEITPEFRLDWFGATGDVKPAFRARMGIVPHDTVRISLAGGRYEQAPSRDELSPVSGNPELDPEGAWHVNLGATWAPGPFLDIDLQGYLKLLDNQAVSSRSAAAFGDLAALGLSEEDEDDPTHGLSNSGIGRIWGMEAFARFAFLPGGALSGWVGYSLSWAQRKDFEDEAWRWFQHDRRHALSLLLQLKLPGEFQIGARWQIQSGAPLTPVEDSTYFADFGTFVPEYGDLYSARGRPYHQLDLRIDKRFRQKFHVVDLFIDVTNLYAATYSDFELYRYDYRETAAFTGIPGINFGVRVEF